MSSIACLAIAAIQLMKGTLFIYHQHKPLAFGQSTMLHEKYCLCLSCTVRSLIDACLLLLLIGKLTLLIDHHIQALSP